MIHEERFLTDKLRMVEIRIFEDPDQFIPAKMAGDVLLADFREEITTHFVTMVGSGCSERSLLKQDFFAEAIVEGKEKAGPFFAAQAFKRLD